MNLDQPGPDRKAIRPWPVDPGLHSHFLHRWLGRIALAPRGRDPVPVRHDAGLRLLGGKRETFDVLDVVDAGIARNDQAQGSAMGQRDRHAVHFPRKHRIGHGLSRHRAFDNDTFWIDSVG